MSDKPLKWTSDASLAEKILAALQRCGPLKASDIARETMADNGGRRLNHNAINKVLREALADLVVSVERGRWALRCPEAANSTAPNPAGVKSARPSENAIPG